MREIKFRAWDKELKKMYLVRGINFSFPNQVFLRTKLVKGGCYHNDEYDYYQSLDSVELMQFTGLHDKNGKEIWEGDIVLVPNLGYDPSEGDNPCLLLTVGFDLGSFIIGDDFMSEFDFINDVEVLGNIYENPELLKDTK